MNPYTDHLTRPPGRGTERFVRETLARVRRAGATGPITLRADSGFWSKKVIKACRDHDVRYSITVRRHQAIVTAIESIPDSTWVDIAYTASGDAQVAECPYGDGHRLVVRRTRIKGAQPFLFEQWRHHAFITDIHGPRVAKTMRRRRFSIAGRITRSGRIRTLHLPTRCPWTDQSIAIVGAPRALPAPPN